MSQKVAFFIVPADGGFGGHIHIVNVTKECLYYPTNALNYINCKVIKNT